MLSITAADQAVDREAAAAKVGHLDRLLVAFAIARQFGACRVASKTGFHEVQAVGVVADQLEVFQSVGNDAVAHVGFDVENADYHTQRFVPRAPCVIAVGDNLFGVLHVGRFRLCRINAHDRQGCVHAQGVVVGRAAGIASAGAGLSQVFAVARIIHPPLSKLDNVVMRRHIITKVLNDSLSQP